jgi:hypothetical protein
MEKSLIVKLTTCLLVGGIGLIVSACNASPSDSLVETAVAETLAAAPEQPSGEVLEVEVTRVMEVTKVVQVPVTTTPEPTKDVTETATPESTATTTVTPTATSIFAAGETEAEPTAPIEPSGPLGLGLNQLINRYTGMTDLQKKEFAAALPGKTVYWTGQVYNIMTDGTIILDNPYGAGRVTLLGIAPEDAIDIDKDMLVDFRGMIVSFGGTFGRDIVITNAELVRYYFEPTATPTPGR